MADTHHHHHHPPHHDEPRGPEPPMDPANQSLSEALRVSFRLLTVIMVFVLVFFALSGFKSIEPTERGVVRIFGRIDRVAESGLAYTWPYPVGDIQRVQVNEQKLNIDDFWMHVRSTDQGKDISDIKPLSRGLRPGWDGALLSGDRYFFHVRIKVTYVVRDPERYLLRVAGTEETVRSVVCQAAIRAAAVRTADRVKNNRDEFVTEIRRESQNRLQALQTGITVTSVEVPNFTWPLRALNSFEAETAAITEKSKQIDEARGGAEQLLAATAGQVGYQKLVGMPWSEVIAEIRPEETVTPEVDLDEYDLIGRYEQARTEGDANAARQLLERIDRILFSDITEGEASAIIESARRYKMSVRERIAAQAKQFEELLPKYEETPELFIRKRWLATREEILRSPTMYRQYLPVLGGGRTVLYLGMEGDILRGIKRQELTESQKQKEQELKEATLRPERE
ncbi:MAG: SPFH domain-containing protein [Phycisphaerae bacterium]